MAYPPSFEERNGIADSFLKKLSSFGEGKSPLAVYIKTNDINVADLTEKNSDAATDNILASKAAKAAENATEQRNLLWVNPLKHLHQIGDYLKTIYPANPRALGDWGFVVDESVATGKERKVKLIIGQTKVVNSIKIGCITTNTGKGNVLLYKGKDITEVAAVLKPGDKMGMIKGYSTITLVNPSTPETGIVVISLSDDSK